MLRILGEALTNALRHARARRVVVRVWGFADRLYAEVCDDGRRIRSRSPSAQTERYGITGMRERAGLLHGRLAISSDPHMGTAVRLDVPIHDDANARVKHVRVLLVEDHAAVREAIASAFERDAGFDIVGQAASLAQARGMLEGVDAAVLDLALPDDSGADLIKELHEVNPQAQPLKAPRRRRLVRAAGAAGAVPRRGGRSVARMAGRFGSGRPGRAPARSFVSPPR